MDGIKQFSAPFPVVRNILSLLESSRKEEDFKIALYEKLEDGERAKYIVKNLEFEIVPKLLRFHTMDVYLHSTATVSMAAITGHFSLGAVAMQAQFSFCAMPVWIITLKPEKDRFPGLRDLLAWLGTDGDAGGFFSILPGPGLPAFDAAISAVQFQLDVEQMKLRRLSLESVLQFGALELAVTVDLPDKRISGGLRKEQPLFMRDFLASLGVSGEAVPENLRISRADFGGDLQNHTCYLEITADSIWKSEYLTIEEVSFSLKAKEGGRMDVAVNGVFTVSDSIQLDLTGKRDGGEWFFAGEYLSWDEEGSGFCEFLARKFGVPLPEWLSHLSLNALTLSYDSRSHDFRFTAAGGLRFGGAEITAKIELHFQKNEAGHTLAINGTAEIARHTFILRFVNGADYCLVLTDYKAAASEAVRLADLVAAVAPGVSVAGNIQIAMSQARLILLSDKSGGKEEMLYSFGVGLGAEIHLTGLPVVGGMIPAALDASIGKLQLAYYSAGYTEKQLALFKRLPEKDRFLLPSGQAEKGVFVSGELTVAGSVHPIAAGGAAKDGQPGKLPVPGGETGLTGDSKVKWLQIERSLGPFHLGRVGLAFEDGRITFLIDGGVSIGPLTCNLYGLSITGGIEAFSPRMELAGLGISYGTPGVSVLGSMARVDNEQVALQYSGTVGVKVSDWSFVAVGSYSELKSGGTSFFLYLDASVKIAVSPAFIIEGFAAGMGLNYKMTCPEMTDVYNFPLMQAQRKETPEDTLKILEGRKADANHVTRQWLQPSAGDYWIAAGIRFSFNELMSGNMILVARFGEGLQFSLLGLARLCLPKGAGKDAAYVYAELQMLSVLRPNDGCFTMQAGLTPASFLLSKSCRLYGGVAFSLWFGSNPHAGDFVLTIGGYHAAFRPPDHYPSVDRAGFSWKVSDTVSIKGEAYLAVTPSCVMAGGRLEVVFQSGDIHAWFTAGADFLVAFHPFSFAAEIHIAVGVSVKLNLALFTVNLSLSLGASLELWGPPTGGAVTVHLSLLSFTICFGSGNAADKRYLALPWGDFKALLPSDNEVCRLQVASGLREIMTVGEKEVWVAEAYGFSLIAQTAVPVTELVYGNDHKQVDSGIHIRPMDLSNASSILSIRLYHQHDPETPVDLIARGWSLEPRVTSVPEALWGEPLRRNGKFIQNDDRPGSKTAPDKCMGFHLQPPPPAMNTQITVASFSEAMAEVQNVPNPLPALLKESGLFRPEADRAPLASVASIATDEVDAKRRALLQALGGVFQTEACSFGVMADHVDEIFYNAPMVARGGVECAGDSGK